jgi:hypothetical protein
MKKITLVLALLLTFGLVAATAQDATVTGSATSTVGFDLDDTTFGIVNSASSTLDLTLASGSVETEAADGWYGWVKLASFKISFEETDVVKVTAPGVTAKVINGPMYFQIWALDGFAVDMAGEVENGKFAVEGTDGDVVTDLSNGSGGFTFGYMADAFDVKVHFATETGYGGGDSANNGHFLVGVDAGLAAGPADIDLAVVRGIGVDEVLGLGVKADLSALVEALSLVVAFDGQIPAPGTFNYEVRADVGFAADPITVGVDFIYGDLVDMDLELDVDLALDPITVGIFFGGWDMFATWAADVDLSFVVNDQVTVAAGFGYDSAGSIPVDVTATMKLIPNTTFTLKYATTDVATSLGQVTFATKVAY